MWYNSLNHKTMNKLNTIISLCLIIIIGIFVFTNRSVDKSLGSSGAVVPQATFATSTSYTITSASTYVEASTTRTYYSFTNASPSTIYLAFLGGNAAVAGKGVTIFASTTYEMTPAKENLYYGAIRAITDAGANGTLIVTGY